MLAALSLLFLALTGFLVLSVWGRGRLEVEANFPKGYRVFSADLGQETRMGSRGAILLRDNEWGLTGKVDLLLQHIATRAVIPVEYKSAGEGFEPRNVRPSHVLQLATALVLCQGDSRVGQTPPEGWIRYIDEHGILAPRGEVRIQNTPEIRDWVIATGQRMRRALATSEELHRDHHSPAKCQRCALRHLCDEALAG
jgi:CRISPR/Cas system-associated exonuclease Cas4 (RecB family)